jgi:hypothetical protein
MRLTPLWASSGKQAYGASKAEAMAQITATRLCPSFFNITSLITILPLVGRNGRLLATKQMGRPRLGRLDMSCKLQITLVQRR